MIGMELQLTPDSRALLERLAKETPDAAKKAFYRAASIVSRRMRARMNPRRRFVAPWAEVTARIRDIYKTEYAKTFGGNLMYPKGRQIAIKPLPGGGAVVGWVDALEAPAVRFQRGGSEPTSSHWRQFLYRRGIEHDAVPKTAVTPERPIVDPVAEESNGKFPEWMIGALKTILKKRVARAELQYAKSPATEEGARAASRAVSAHSALAMIQEAGYR